MIEKQELHCHGCGKFVQFILNFDSDGNYSIPCPECGHMHYRIIRNGRITGDRWQSSMDFIQIYGATSSASSATTNNYGTTSTALGYFESIGTVWY